MYISKKNEIITSMTFDEVEETRVDVAKRYNLEGGICEECAIKINWYEKPDSFCCHEGVLFLEWDSVNELFEESFLDDDDY